jgi:hypothetical protein
MILIHEAVNGLLAGEIAAIADTHTRGSGRRFGSATRLAGGPRKTMVRPTRNMQTLRGQAGRPVLQAYCF